MCDGHLSTKRVCSVALSSSFAQDVCTKAAPFLNQKTLQLESATYELVSMLLMDRQGEEEGEALASSSESEAPLTPRTSTSRRMSIPAVDFNLNPGEKSHLRKVHQRTELRQEAQYLMGHFYRKNTDALIRCTRITLDMIRKVLAPPTLYSLDKKQERVPTLKLQLVLAIPNIAIRPSLEDVQTTVNQIVQTILDVHKEVFQWGSTGKDAPLISPSQGILAAASTVLKSQTQMTAAAITTSSTAFATTKKAGDKNFYRTVYENKEIAKLKTTLASIITSGKKLVTDSFVHFSKYQDLWIKEREQQVQEFGKEEHLIGDYEDQLKMYQEIELSVMEEEETITIGPIYMETSECIEWT